LINYDKFIPLALLPLLLLAIVDVLDLYNPSANFVMATGLGGGMGIGVIVMIKVLRED